MSDVRLWTKVESASGADYDKPPLPTEATEGDGSLYVLKSGCRWVCYETPIGLRCICRPNAKEVYEDLRSGKK